MLAHTPCVESATTTGSSATEQIIANAIERSSCPTSTPIPSGDLGPELAIRQDVVSRKVGTNAGEVVVERFLQGARFNSGLITRAFLGLSYEPGKGYPVFDLELVRA
jgi:hypothetical protein